MTEFRRYHSKNTSNFLKDRGVLGDDMGLWGIYYRAKESRDKGDSGIYKVRVSMAVYKQSIWDNQKRELIEHTF